MLVGVVILGNLSAWQLRRHAFKNRWHEQEVAATGLPAVEGLPDDALFRQVRLDGRFTGGVMLEGGRSLGHAPGYGVLQRFVLADGRGVLVDRGEVESIAAASGLDAATAVAGQLRPLPDTRDREPVPGTDPPVWPQKSMVGIHARAGDVLPGVYVKSGASLAAKRRYDSLHYAKQWAAMAVILVGMWAFASWERS